MQSQRVAEVLAVSMAIKIEQRLHLILLVRVSNLKLIRTDSPQNPGLKHCFGQFGHDRRKGMHSALQELVAPACAAIGLPARKTRLGPTRRVARGP
jgi:hypothetical protein